MAFDNLETLKTRFDARDSGNDFAGIAFANEVCGFYPGAALGGSRVRSAVSDERLAERTPIDPEPHDTLLQGFVAASLHLHAVVNRMSSDCPEKQRLADIAQMMERVLNEGRCALQDLRSPNELGASLGEALARVPSDLGFASHSGFRVVVLGK